MTHLDEQLSAIADLFAAAGDLDVPTSTFTATSPTFGSPYELTPGTLDQAARDAFTCGWCWALAVTLAADRGWAVWVAGEPDDEVWYHVVASPDGETFFDIDGPTDAAHLRKQWGALWVASVAMLRGLINTDDDDLIDALTAAAAFADSVPTAEQIDASA